jgi:hypothetical protein
MTSRVLKARASFLAEIDGRTVVVLEGARFPAKDPIVRGREALFEPARRATKKRKV